LPDLVASYWTVSGTLPGDAQEASVYGFRERVAAVARAGFRGMGFWHSDLVAVMESLTLAEMKRILEDHGIVRVEVEFLVDWFLEGPRKQASLERQSLLFRAAEGLGAQTVKVGDFFNERVPMARLTDAFGELCRQAAAVGTNIVFEPMASACVHTLADSLALVRGAGAPNGGLALDVWHMVNQGESFHDIARVPLEYLFAVELNDSPVRPDEPRNFRAVHPRRFCGQGGFDLPGFVAAVRATGYTGPWGVEVISPELVSLGLDEAARRAFQSTVPFLAGSPSSST